MSVSFDALLFFGMPIKSGCDYKLVETFNESNRQLEIMNLSPMTAGENYMLFVRESYHSADKNEDEMLIKLSDLAGDESTWRELIEDACIANGLDFTEPDWYFATMFS